MKALFKLTLLITALTLLTGCEGSQKSSEGTSESGAMTDNAVVVIVQAENFIQSSGDFAKVEGDVTFVEVPSEGWLEYDVAFERAGRYQVEVFAATESEESSVWLEYYVGNPDGRTYNVTGSINIAVNNGFHGFSVDGSPFNSNNHKMKLHVPNGSVKVDKIQFRLLKKHQKTPQVYTQKMDGKDWKLVWSDEFEGQVVDTTKWIYDIGNWGWGNNELQYYTQGRTENARVRDGHLIIEARKNDMDQEWTSARLTTRGKASFLYGKIEFKARVPREKGNWAAAWTLGDSYIDEVAWPYCGEIDILESVGYEVNDETGDGIAHCTVHTPAYYFKINNQISSVKDIKNIAGEFHTYAVEWTPTEIRGFVDGEQYYVYDKNADEKEWPFSTPQNIIVNLAMGGGWGGAQGMDPDVTSQEFILDYVRVYDLN